MILVFVVPELKPLQHSCRESARTSQESNTPPDCAAEKLPFPRYTDGMISKASVIPIYLVRYGAIPEVVKAVWQGGGSLVRGKSVVLRTHRGVVLGEVLETVRPTSEPGVNETPPTSEILREATDSDNDQLNRLRLKSQAEFPAWQQRIEQWGLDLQLIDLEWTLDEEKVCLYVLNERGPECTKLALQAAAAGLGIIDVQPVSLEGLVTLPAGGGGCGSCGMH
jgi:hypothetical protein